MKIYRPVGFFMGFCAILLGIILYFRESNVQGFVLLGSLLVVGVPLIRWSFSDEAEQRAEKIKSEFQRISTPALILSQLCMFALAAFFCFVGNPDLVPIGIGLFLGLVIMMLVEMVLALYHSYREKHL